MPNIQPTQPTFEKQAKPVDNTANNIKNIEKTTEGGLKTEKGKVNEKATLNPAEKLAIGAAAAAVGGVAGAAAAAICLVDDDMVNSLKETGNKIKEGVKEHYEHPPEEKMLEKLKKFGKEAGESMEEFVDDVKDGRITRDISKGAKRFVRDNFSEQSKTDKFKNLVKDAAEDLGDAAADLSDDIKDGRIKVKID